VSIDVSVVLITLIERPPKEGDMKPLYRFLNRAEAIAENGFVLLKKAMDSQYIWG